MGGDGASSALHTSYLKAKNLLLASSNNIYLMNNSSIEVEGTLQCNKNASAMIFLQGANSKAYIKANPEFKSMLEEKLKEFRTNKDVEE